MLHNGARELDGILHVREAAHRSGSARRAVHDGRVELVLSVMREHGAAAGVEQRIVLERDHGAGHRL